MGRLPFQGQTIANKSYLQLIIPSQNQMSQKVLEKISIKYVSYVDGIAE